MSDATRLQQAVMKVLVQFLPDMREDNRLDQIRLVNSYLVPGCQAIFLGDGEFDVSEVVFSLN